MPKFLRLATCVLLLGSVLACDEPHNYVPEGGIVPDADTAIKIAEVVAVRIYGQDRIDRQQPLVASLFGGTWTVKGTLPPHLLGGTVEIDVARADGRVSRVTHGK